MSVDFGPVEKAVLGREEMARVEALCLCPGCPAYPQGDFGNKVAYCLRGASGHKDQIDPEDCLCEMCEVYKGGRLYGRNFFCLEGAALKQGLRNVLAGKLITHLPEQKEDVAPALMVSAGLDVHKREGTHGRDEVV